MDSTDAALWYRVVKIHSSLLFVGMLFDCKRMATTLYQLKLIPFYGATLLYFYLYTPYYGYPPENIQAAFFKALPIWCLVFSIVTPEQPRSSAKKSFMFGLMLSSVGDMFLIWIRKQTMFYIGTVFFAIARYFYIRSVEHDVSKPISRWTLWIPISSIIIFLVVTPGLRDVLCIVLDIIYTILSCHLLYLQGRTYRETRRRQYLQGCIGSCLFMLSDFVIVVNMHAFYVPHHEFIIMVTYYAAQLLLTLSN